MPLTLQDAINQLRDTRATAAEKKAARKEAEDKAKVAVDEDRAAVTAEENARERFNGVVDALTFPAAALK